jgi:Protein of unknown function (DUF664)
LTYTGTNLLSVIKHLSITEAWCFGDVFGRPFPGRWPRWDDPAGHLDDMWAAGDVSRGETVDRYRRAWDHSDAAIASLAESQKSWMTSERTLGQLLRVLDAVNQLGLVAGIATTSRPRGVQLLTAQSDGRQEATWLTRRIAWLLFRCGPTRCAGCASWRRR